MSVDPEKKDLGLAFAGLNGSDCPNEPDMLATVFQAVFGHRAYVTIEEGRDGKLIVHIPFSGQLEWTVTLDRVDTLNSTMPQLVDLILLVQEKLEETRVSASPDAGEA